MCSFFVLVPAYLEPSAPSAFFALLCSLSVRYGPGLNGTHSTLFFLCSHVFFFCFGPSLSGTQRTLCFLCSHVILLLMFWSRLNCDSPQPLLSLLSCVLSLVISAPDYLRLAPHSALCVLIFFCFGLGLTGTQPTLCFICSFVFSSCSLWSRPNWDPPHPLLSLLS